jgi:hypothetical protein
MPARGTAMQEVSGERMLDTHLAKAVGTVAVATRTVTSVEEVVIT